LAPLINYIKFFIQMIYILFGLYVSLEFYFLKVVVRRNNEFIKVVIHRTFKMIGL